MALQNFFPDSAPVTQAMDTLGVARSNPFNLTQNITHLYQ